MELLSSAAEWIIRFIFVLFIGVCAVRHERLKHKMGKGGYPRMRVLRDQRWREVVPAKSLHRSFTWVLKPCDVHIVQPLA